MKLRDGTDKVLELYAVPLICKALAAQPITLCVANYSYLARLELADSSDGKGAMDVDMLIGADYYWKLTTGQISYSYIPTGRDVTGLSPVGYYGLRHTAALLLWSLVGNCFVSYCNTVAMEFRW